MIIAGAAPGLTRKPTRASNSAAAEFTAAMSTTLGGAHTARQMFLPEITTTDDTHPTPPGACTTTSRPRSSTSDGHGHISHDHVKAGGQRKIIRGDAARPIADEEWLTGTSYPASARPRPGRPPS